MSGTNTLQYCDGVDSKSNNLDTSSALKYKTVQIVGYTDYLDIIERPIVGAKKLLKDIKTTLGKIVLRINDKKTKRG